jgi:hypothetical protein
MHLFTRPLETLFLEYMHLFALFLKLKIVLLSHNITILFAQELHNQ